jgi:DNA-binding XRE family transcriptional regulator
MEEVPPADPPPIVPAYPEKVDLRISPAQREDTSIAEESRLLFDYLAALRRAEGITQTQLAERMGTDQRTVSQLERGRHDPKISRVMVWGGALGVRFGLAKDGGSLELRPSPKQES